MEDTTLDERTNTLTHKRVNTNGFTEIYTSSIQYPQQNYNITVNRVLKWKIDLTNTNVILVEPNESFGNCKNQVVIDVVKICSTM
ncbi:unnamed protein product [Rotaria sp. Silwood2]|nr:unnamed protein product [Rotaria sp. Silwood2]CAF3267238.1 unnamed protein product [Rotaria sp. Silwood2]CAF4303286.1 unnamed protein product [Rotaria sp. Silwood2]